VTLLYTKKISLCSTMSYHHGSGAWSYGGILVVLQMVLQWCHSGVTLVFEWCCSGVTVYHHGWGATAQAASLTAPPVSHPVCVRV
jgi:hypothetical protein